jgi:hypothetical protein
MLYLPLKRKWRIIAFRRGCALWLLPMNCENQGALYETQGMFKELSKNKLYNLAQDFFRQARRSVPLILAVSTGSANAA